MKKTILSLVAAGALGLAGTAAAPQQAHALVWWVVPAIVGGTVGGVVLGAAAANQANAAYYGPQGAVYVAPTANCHWARVRTDRGWIRERVCQ